MSQSASAPRIPSLRFPEFSGEWEEKKFGDVVSLSSSKHNSEKNKSVQKCIELEHIDQVTGRLLGFVEGNDFGSIKNKFNKNNVLFGKLRPYLRKYIKAPFDGLCSSEIWVLDGKLVSNDYLYYIVQLEKFIELADQSIGSKMPRADWSHVSSGIFLIPSLPEQTKIAAFLSSVDTKIDQFSQKKALLEQYKKGVMQQIFSQQIRFKADDGSDYPEWEERRFGEISISHYQGINTTADKLEYFPEGFPIIQAKHITNNFLDMQDVRFVSCEKYNLYKDKYQPKLGEILISNIGTLGKVVLVEEEFSFLIAWNIFKVALANNVNPKYVTYFLKKISGEGVFESLQTGNATKFINKSDMLSIVVFLPSLSEQTKIAHFLSAIDSKIEQVVQQLEAAKQFKKGLLQQMFV